MILHPFAYDNTDIVANDAFQIVVALNVVLYNEMYWTTGACIGVATTSKCIINNSVAIDLI